MLYAKEAYFSSLAHAVKMAPPLCFDSPSQLLAAESIAVHSKEIRTMVSLIASCSRLAVAHAQRCAASSVTNYGTRVPGQEPTCLWYVS